MHLGSCCMSCCRGYCRLPSATKTGKTEQCCFTSASQRKFPPLSLTQPISPQLQALLRQMLARDAAVRPAHAGMVRERFRDIPEIQAISSTLPERSGQMVIPSSALSGGAEGQTTSATVSALSLVERGTLFPVLLALTIVATLLTFAYLLFGPPHS
jgi:hypothetical protein